MGVMGAEYSGVAGVKVASSSYESNSSEAADWRGSTTAAVDAAAGTTGAVSKKLSFAKVLLLLLSVGVLTNSGSKRLSVAAAAGCAPATGGEEKSESSNGLNDSATDVAASTGANASAIVK